MTLNERARHHIEVSLSKEWRQATPRYGIEKVISDAINNMTQAEFLEFISDALDAIKEENHAK